MGLGRWAVVGLGIAVLMGSTGARAQSSAVGQWTAPALWPMSATHTHLLPTGKVLVMGEQGQGLLPPLLWDPPTNTLTQVAAADFNIFCSGHSFLPDGRLFIAGGHEMSHVGYPYVRIFDPFTLSWSSSVPDMNGNRWYPSVTTLPSGDVLVTSGEMHEAGENNPLHQVWQRQTNTWRDLTNAVYELPYYPRQFVAPNGRVLVAGPLRGMRWLDTTGLGAWIGAGNSNCCARTYGPALNKDGKVYLLGGGDPPTAAVERIDLNAVEPVAVNMAPMLNPRRQHNATFLPDGRILVTGGSTAAGFDEESAPADYADVFDPEANTWTRWSAATGYYGYHSTAILVPDGRVLVAGGAGEKDMQVFSPPYLFQGGTRPTVTAAPSRITPGGSFTISTPNGATIRKVGLIALGSTTHAFDQNTRYLTLPFQVTSGGLQLTAPANNAVAPPGPYQLFLVDDRGVPSVGRMVTVDIVAPNTRRVLKLSDTWKYDDRGIDRGTAWIQPGYDDSSWSAGTGQFGYGDTDNATTLNKLSPIQPSYYFRKTFTLSSLPSQATLEVIHDDGAAVWVNGVQVFSSGMGNGTAYGAWASESVSNKISRAQLNLAPFRVGENTIAVMVKQVSATSTDLSFALQLDVRDGAPPADAVSVFAPNGGETLSTGTTAVIAWQTVGSARPTVDLAWSANNGSTWTTIANGVPNTGSYNWTVPAATTSQARVRVSSATSPAVSDLSDATFTITQAVRRIAIPYGSVWKYSATGLDPGSTWNQASYNDSAWSSGPGQLGYGESDQATTLVPTSPVQSSVYFRRTVQVNGAVSAALLDALFDDGIAVWVNGTLAFSRNMDRGLAHSSYASASGENTRATATLSPSLFLQGPNQLAVMVKQVGATSSDISFDLSLTLDEQPTAETMRVVSPNGGETLVIGSTHEITWTGTSLGSAVDLSFGMGEMGHWMPIAFGAPNNGHFTWTVPNEPTTNGRVKVTVVGNPSLSDESNGNFTVTGSSGVSAIPFGSVWKYQDNGLDPGATWNTAGFSDSLWKSGAGQLGYGDGDEQTVLTKTVPSQTSVYFRKTITVNGTVNEAALHAIFDDGIAVWVNGTLVLTQNLGSGTAHAKYATVSAENAEVDTLLSLSPNPFVRGTNVIGVMVKQNGSTSPDLSFDLQLDLRVTP